MRKCQGKDCQARSPGLLEFTGLCTTHSAAFGQSLRRVSPEETFKIVFLVSKDVFTLQGTVLSQGSGFVRAMLFILKVEIRRHGKAEF